ncbi:hypothetical protein IE077_000016 [Cardiosporidium cionae]|uniref:Dynein light intermediate chain n=1 Tax=Cardiosporidium cionae TaxID=476202 RepID=A0ABQ7JEA7_9APIC|nr:hypothetical protein IE077_000016 [Cardiosporidium cionae]|eukprot:KAF8822224.1 hypothetical protein IE077_000016 [Cardiosporidium cionae]
MRRLSSSNRRSSEAVPFSAVPRPDIDEPENMAQPCFSESQPALKLSSEVDNSASPAATVPHITAPSKGQTVHISAQEGIWHQMLAGSKSKSSLSEDGHILLFGTQDVGKSSLIRILQQFGSNEVLSENELYANTHGVSAIDNAYINARPLDVTEDLQTADIEKQANVWILQSPHYTSLLKNRLKPLFLEKMVILICLNLQHPWTMLSQLQEWLSVATDVINPLKEALPLEKQDQLNEKMEKYIQDYKKSLLEGGGFSHGGFQEESISHPKVTPGETFQLSRNLGVPIIVTVCKSDIYKSLDSYKTPGLFDVILSYLRHTCLPYGAALIFSNLKSFDHQHNCLLLYRYLMHHLFGYEFLEQAVMDSQANYFLPSGWDTEEEIRTFVTKTVAEDFSKPYESIVSKPVSSTKAATSGEDALYVESVDKFLSRLSDTHPVVQEVQETASSKAKKAIIFPKDAATHPVVPSNVSKEKPEIPKTAPEGPAKGSEKDSASLQDFFKGLMAKGSRKSNTSSKEKGRRERPNVIAEGAAEASETAEKRED